MERTVKDEIIFWGIAACAAVICVYVLGYAIRSAENNVEKGSANAVGNFIPDTLSVFTTGIENLFGMTPGSNNGCSGQSC